MKFNLIYIIVVSALIGMAGCDDKIEPFEIMGSTAAPAAISASAVQSEALPGEIKLTWTAPEEDFAYMQIRYNDPLQKKDICKLVSKNTTELLVENTRARFGDYSFFFQTFNVANQGSAVTEVKAKSGAAPATMTEKSRKEVKLTKEQLLCNYPDASEGQYAHLVDGNPETFFHSNWHSPQSPLPHYIQIAFEEEHENFAFGYWTRNTSNTDGYPTAAEFQISNDGENWETVTVLSGLPATKATRYSSDYVIAGKKFKYFRFNVISSSLNKNYFHIGEIYFYDVEVEVYDPETVPLD